MAEYKTSGQVVLNEEQVLALHRKMRDMCHDVNGRLANMAAAAELIRLRPTTVEERLPILLDQPHEAKKALEVFSREFETALGLSRA